MTHPPNPSPPRVWNDKADIHIPGAGTFGITLLIISLSVIFAATMILLLVFRYSILAGTAWHDPTILTLPKSLWLSTALIVISSLAIHRALAAIRRDDERGLVSALALTFALGILFLFIQSWNWYEVYAQIAGSPNPRNFYVVFFYMLTVLHALHVLGGLIPMARTLAKARRHVYSRNFHPGVRYCVAYWHFLTVVWLIFFTLIYLT